MRTNGAKIHLKFNTKNNQQKKLGDVRKEFEPHEVVGKVNYDFKMMDHLVSLTTETEPSCFLCSAGFSGALT